MFADAARAHAPPYCSTLLLHLPCPRTSIAFGSSSSTPNRTVTLCSRTLVPGQSCEAASMGTAAQGKGRFDKKWRMLVTGCPSATTA